MPTTKYWTGSQWIPIPGPPAGQVWTQPIGDGVNTSFTAWHGLGTRNVIVAVYRNSAPYDEVECDVERTDANTVIIRTLPYVPTLNEFILVVASGGAQATLNIAMDQWHNVGSAGEPALVNAWVSVDQPKFRKYPDGRVRISGMARSGSAPTVFVLPTGYRPAQTQRIATTSNNGGTTVLCELMVLTTGEVQVYGSAATTFVSLYIEFDTESVTQVAAIGAQPLDKWHYIGDPGEPIFLNTTTNWDGPAPAGRAARFRKYPDGRVRLEGIVKVQIATGAIFNLPVGYRPAANTELYWPVVANAALTFVNVSSATGTVSVTGAAVNGWLDLSSIEFDTGLMGYVTGSFPYLPVTMDSWHTVGAAGEPAYATGGAGGNWVSGATSGYGGLRFRKYPDGKVKLTGFAKPTNFIANDPVFTLPVGYRPTANLVFSTRASGASAGQELANRIDVMSTGVVTCVSGGSANPAGWVTFDGIEFDVEDVRQVASSAAQPIEGWHYIGAVGEPAFQNNWVNFDGRAAAFRKYPDGKVRFRGLIKSGTIGAAAFTLPVGYRPLTGADNGEVYFPCASNSALGIAYVKPDGTPTPGIVVPNVGSNVWFDLASIEFDTGTVSSYATATVQINAPPRVTSLPVAPAPVDGQEVYLVVDAANQIVWHLRYNASGAYKWEFLGGQPLYAFVASPSAPAVTGSWTSPADWPAIPLPIAGIVGDWLVETGGRITNNNIRTTPNFACFMTGFGTALISGLTTYNPQVGLETAAMRGKTGVVPAAAWPFRLGYSLFGSAPAIADVTYDNLWISVLPVRIGT